MADTSKGATASNVPVVDFMGVQRNDRAAVLVATNATVGPLQTDSAGNMRVDQEGGKLTYSANSSFACDATATDIATFPGTNSAVCKIKKIVISTLATAGAVGVVNLIRRSTANTGFTTAASVTACFDITSAVPNVLPYHATAHPTAFGTAVATCWGERVIQGATANIPISRVELNFDGTNGGQGLVVRNASDFINVSAVAALGGSGNLWSVQWVWVEEPTTA